MFYCDNTNKKDDFIVTSRTRCYFIDAILKVIATGVVIGYNNITRVVTIRYKNAPNTYTVVYRNRDYVWFDLECCLLWFYKYMMDYGMQHTEVMDLTDQLDGEKTVLTLSDNIYSGYTIYLNGLRQNREDYIMDNTNHTLTILIDPIPNQYDILTIEYLKGNELPV